MGPLLWKWRETNMKGEGVSLSLFLLFAVPNSSDHWTVWICCHYWLYRILTKTDRGQVASVKMPLLTCSCSFCCYNICLVSQYSAILKKYKSVIKSFAGYFFSKWVRFCVTIGRFFAAWHGNIESTNDMSWGRDHLFGQPMEDKLVSLKLNL